MDKNRSKSSESLKIALWHLQQTQNTYFEHKIGAGQWPAREILGSQTNILPTFRCTSPNLQHQLLGGALSIVIVILTPPLAGHTIHTDLRIKLPPERSKNKTRDLPVVLLLSSLYRLCWTKTP